MVISKVSTPSRFSGQQIAYAYLYIYIYCVGYKCIMWHKGETNGWCSLWKYTHIWRHKSLFLRERFEYIYETDWRQTSIQPHPVSTHLESRTSRITLLIVIRCALKRLTALIKRAANAFTFLNPSRRVQRYARRVFNEVRLRRRKLHKLWANTEICRKKKTDANNRLIEENRFMFND